MTRRNPESTRARTVRGVRAFLVVAATLLSLGQIVACVPGTYYVGGYHRPAYYRYGYGYYYDPYYTQPYPYYRGGGYGVVVAPPAPGVVVAPPRPGVVVAPGGPGPVRPGVVVAPGGPGPHVVVPR